MSEPAEGEFDLSLLNDEELTEQVTTTYTTASRPRSKKRREFS